jgi:hypothetical protein
MTTGAQLKTFIEGLNADATIDATLLDVLVDNARSIVEEERPWMVLRKTNTSKTASSANTWQTAIDLSTITDFSRFYGEMPIILFDGSNQRTHYRLVPFDRRLEYKDVSHTACYDENSKNLYLNGVVPYSGTLYINYISSSTAIDLTSESAVWTIFPSRFLPLLGYYAIGIYKGAVDYDSINRQMLPENREALKALKNAMENWDNEKQLNSLEGNDPTDLYTYPRGGAIDRSN